MSMYSGKVAFPTGQTTLRIGKTYGGRGFIEGQRVRISFRGVLKEGDGGSNHQLLGDMVRSRTKSPHPTHPNEIDFQVRVVASGVRVEIYGTPPTLNTLQSNPDRTRNIGTSILDKFPDLAGLSYEVHVGGKKVWWPGMPKRYTPLESC